MTTPRLLTGKKLTIVPDGSQTEPAFIINNLVKIYNIAQGEQPDQIEFSFDFNEDKINEEEAQKLAEQAIQEIIAFGVEKMDEDVLLNDEAEQA